MPVHPGRLFGRETDIQATSALLLRPEVRLLTLTGPAGTGKTRLAIALAESVATEFHQRVGFVDLAPLTDPALVLPAIADAAAVTESTHADLLERVIDTLTEGPALLVVDNFEHLLTAAPLLSELLARAPLVKILATSRERLNLRWEYVRAVHPLAVDTPPHGEPNCPERGPAVELFLDRARAIQPDLQTDDAVIQTIRDVCHRLDGLPLAIELAAGRFGTLPLTELVRRLGTNPALLSGPRDAPDRHQTLEHAITWSYDLLSGAEQHVFARMGVFAGGFPLEGAESVCRAGDTDASEIASIVARLVDRSLVVAVHDRALPRYRLLEMIRAFCLQRLRRSGELEATHARHLQWCQALADAEREAWATGAASQTQSEWLRLDAERDNVRVALRWCVEAGNAQPGLRLAATLWPYWFTRGLFTEWRMWLEELVRVPGAEARTIYRARALGALSHALSQQGFASDFDRMVALANEAVEIAFELDDPGTRVQTLDVLGVIMRRAGRHAESLEALKTGLGLIETWAEPEHVWWERMLLSNLARGSLDLRRRTDARAWSTRSLAISRKSGMRFDLARALLQWGAIAFLDGNPSAARDAFSEGLAISRATNDPATSALMLRELGIVELACGNSSAAGDAFEQALAALRSLSEPEVACDVLAGIVALVAGDQPTASLQLAGAIEQLKGELVGAGLADVLQSNFQRAVDLARRQAGGELATQHFDSGAHLRLSDAIDAGARMLNHARREGAEASRKPRPPAGLTVREWEVATLVADGLTNRQIADHLLVGERTIDTHVERLRGKLGLRSRVQIAGWVREQQSRLVRTQPIRPTPDAPSP